MVIVAHLDCVYVREAGEAVNVHSQAQLHTLLARRFQDSGCAPLYAL
jgi:hypothetical protein